MGIVNIIQAPETVTETMQDMGHCPLVYHLVEKQVITMHGDAVFGLPLVMRETTSWMFSSTEQPHQT